MLTVLHTASLARDLLLTPKSAGMVQVQSTDSDIWSAHIWRGGVKYELTLTPVPLHGLRWAGLGWAGLAAVI